MKNTFAILFSLAVSIAPAFSQAADAPSAQPISPDKQVKGVPQPGTKTPQPAAPDTKGADKPGGTEQK